MLNFCKAIYNFWKHLFVLLFLENKNKNTKLASLIALAETSKAKEEKNIAIFQELALQRNHHKMIRKLI